MSSVMTSTKAKIPIPTLNVRNFVRLGKIHELNITLKKG